MWSSRPPSLLLPSSNRSSPASVQTVLRRNRDRLLEQIEQASESAGRAAESTQLLAVSKSVSSRVAMELFRIGQTALGENRIDVLEQKRLDFEAAELAPVWHFIGHIQRNKAARVVRAADVIHSVDSLSLLRALDRHATEAERTLGILLQVKLTDEEAKHGLPASELAEAVELGRASTSLELRGLMTMAALDDEPERTLSLARQTFDQLAVLGSELPSEAFLDGRVQLSMGMSSDFEEAIAAGADIVRVGSALFEGIDPAERTGVRAKRGGDA